MNYILGIITFVYIIIFENPFVAHNGKLNINFKRRHKA